MCMIKISSIEEEKNIEKFLKKICLSKGYNIFTCEGVSINDKRVNFFERFEVDNECFNKMIENSKKMSDEKFIEKIILLIIEKNLYDINHYKFINYLLRYFNIDYNIILYPNDCSKFLWIKKGCENYVLILDDCKVLSEEMFKITQKNEQKPFRENYLKCIDECLRKNNTPYPGNFDGIVYNQNSLKPFFIIEYSKVNWVYNIGSDIKYHLKWYCDKRKTKWKEDKNRWKSLKDLGKFLGIPVYIIWWGTQEEEYTIGKLEDVQENCYDSIKIIKEQINKKDLLNFFEQLMK
jgi:hypothetical protein